MLTGGRIVHHLDDLIDDPKAILRFLRATRARTLGAHLQAGAKQVRLNGVGRDVRCEIRSMTASAPTPTRTSWPPGWRISRPARAVPCATIFIVHGDPDAELAVEARVKGLGLTAHRPAWREEVDLG